MNGFQNCKKVEDDICVECDSGFGIFKYNAPGNKEITKCRKANTIFRCATAYESVLSLTTYANVLDDIKCRTCDSVSVPTVKNGISSCVVS